MNGNPKTKEFLWKIIQAGLIVFTVLAGIKAVWISLDIDEAYAVAQSYRLACGDRLLAEMWESHQFSAFLGALFIKPYLLLFQSTDYLVIYLRIAGALIHTGLGIWLYRKIKSGFGQKTGFLILMLHLNFLPKWVQSPEFELMHYWFLTAAFLLLYSYFTSSKGGGHYPVLAGICLVGSMMSYPTMILLYPVYLAGICVLEKQKHARKGKRMLKGALLFTGGAAGAGLSFLAYLFSYQTLAEFQKNISYIFLDESHTMYSQADKWANYGGQLRQHGLWYLKYFCVALAVCGAVFLLAVLLRKVSPRKLCLRKMAEPVILAVFLLTALGMQANQILGCLFRNQNQFFLQIRYVAVILPAVYLGIRYHKKMADLFYLCVLPALLSLPAALAITNMTISVTYSRTFLGVLGSILMLSVYCRERREGERSCEGEEKATVNNACCGLQFLQYLLCFGLLAGFFVCRLVLIRVTGCLPVTVAAPLLQMEDGPAKGIYVLQQEARIWNENNILLKETIKKEDRLLYVGAENLAYLISGSVIAAPSTQGTAVYNEMYLHYFEEHPKRLPNVIVIDKTFGINPVYYYSPNNDIIFKWIEENYEDCEITETEFLKILRRQD